MERGDHLISPRTGYSHHGLYLGRQLVIHYHTPDTGFTHGEITITSLDEFCHGQPCFVHEHATRAYSRETSIARAYSRLQEKHYNPVFNNCEHFVNWCINGDHHSQQIHNVASAISAASVAIDLASKTQPVKDPLLKTTASHLGKLVTTTATSNPALKTTVASSLAGLASGASTASLTSTSVAGVLASSLVAPAAAPVIATIATGLGVGYGVKKLFDWLFDD